jgi:CubicO group peptidase (beta-lactamase class C family)
MIVDNLTSKPKWLSGGGGMVSTAGDYARFCQMLLNGGELNGARLLSPKTVALMTSDHLSPGVKYNASFIALLQDQAPTPEMGEGFGLGSLVRKEAGHNPLPG